jgi:hypothetical protein
MPPHAQTGRKSVQLSMTSEFGPRDLRNRLAPASYSRERLDVTVAQIRLPHLSRPGGRNLCNQPLQRWHSG